MQELAAALKAFYAEFLPAYTLESVPETVELPYIAFPIVNPRWDQQVNTYVQIYYPKRQLENLLIMADRLMGAIGEGLKLNLPDGYVMLYPAQQNAQIMSDKVTKSAYISLLINAYHQPGE